MAPDVVGVGQALPGRRASELVEQGPEPLVVGLDARQERLELGVVGAGHRADRVERGEDERLFVGLEVDIQHRHGRLVARDGQCDASVAIDDVIGPAVNHDLLHPTHGIKRARERVLLGFRMDAPVRRVRGSWSGRSSPEPTMRLRQEVGVRSGTVRLCRAWTTCAPLSAASRCERITGCRQHHGGLQCPPRLHTGRDLPWLPEDQGVRFDADRTQRIAIPYTQRTRIRA